jgi:hypothetical protein
MTEELVKIIDDELVAYNNRDLETFCSFYHPNASIMRLDGTIVASGLSDITQVYKNFFAKNPNLHCELKSRIVLSDKIIDEELISGRSDFSEVLHAVVIYQFQENLIHKVWFV